MSKETVILLLTALFGAGGISSAIVPIIKNHIEKGKAQADTTRTNVDISRANAETSLLIEERIFERLEAVDKENAELRKEAAELRRRADAQDKKIADLLSHIAVLERVLRENGICAPQLPFAEAEKG